MGSSPAKGLPAVFTGAQSYAMCRIGLARHGNRPSDAALPKVDVTKRLPGAINVSFFDGHVALVPLENLWTLYWHVDYQRPATRPTK
jgi:prepilin-type processing-associated H-X9-DG protein